LKSAISGSTESLSALSLFAPLSIQIMNPDFLFLAANIRFVVVTVGIPCREE
jgi:hypothetical protein